MQFVPKELLRVRQPSYFMKIWNWFSKMWNWISLVWNWISLVWNWISLVWNWISLVWNWISLVWNWISFVWNWISFVRNRPENGIYYIDWPHEFSATDGSRKNQQATQTKNSWAKITQKTKRNSHLGLFLTAIPQESEKCKHCLLLVTYLLYLF